MLNREIIITYYVFSLTSLLWEFVPERKKVHAVAPSNYVISFADTISIGSPSFIFLLKPEIRHRGLFFD
ncbi:hypothetical protein D6779_00790 [Candidatus Parcubacteria bacterium]|nr:MAG: hypothetical protein D6779_00790 [Candidatus Parcubacteria bacterium]